jgi:hypothetical protein
MPKVGPCQEGSRGDLVDKQVVSGVDLAPIPAISEPVFRATTGKKAATEKFAGVCVHIRKD